MIILHAFFAIHHVLEKVNVQDTVIPCGGQSAGSLDPCVHYTIGAVGPADLLRGY